MGVGYDEVGGCFESGRSRAGACVGGDWRGGGVEYNNMYITLEPPSLFISMLVYLGSLWLQCCLRLVCFRMWDSDACMVWLANKMSIPVQFYFNLMAFYYTLAKLYHHLLIHFLS